MADSKPSEARFECVACCLISPESDLSPSGKCPRCFNRVEQLASKDVAGWLAILRDPTVNPTALQQIGPLVADYIEALQTSFNLECELTDSLQNQLTDQRRAHETKAPRRELSATERLHNICDALNEQADESPFTREEWERIDKETARMQKELGKLRSQVDRLDGLWKLVEENRHGVYDETAALLYVKQYSPSKTNGDAP